MSKGCMQSFDLLALKLRPWCGDTATYRHNFWVFLVFLYIVRFLRVSVTLGDSFLKWHRPELGWPGLNWDRPIPFQARPSQFKPVPRRSWVQKLYFFIAQLHLYRVHKRNVYLYLIPMMLLGVFQNSNQKCFIWVCNYRKVRKVVIFGTFVM